MRRKNLTLPELQKHIKKVCQERGWDRGSVLEKFLLFTEEVGELAKEIRKSLKLDVEKGKSRTPEIELEMADVLNYLLDIANHFNIDLEKAFLAKERINQKREWRKRPDGK